MKRLRHATRRGRLKIVERGLYAVVAPAVGVEAFAPDRFLVAAALRPDAVLAYHSAIELLGLSHSVYRDVFYLTARPRKDVRLSGGRVRALRHPKPLRDRGAESFGIEVHERCGVKLRLTGPERTLVDSFLLPRYAGGIDEVMEAARSVSVLDLDRLERYLVLLDQRRAFAMMGFVLEQAAERLFVPAALLDRLAAQRPIARIYLDRRQRGGRLQPRWNLIVPERWAPEVARAEL
jgi:predicted transcriptional regulator of viral defense system